MCCRGEVFLPDGHTPAWGARVVIVDPEDWPTTIQRQARTDATGHLMAITHPGVCLYPEGAWPVPPPGNPPGPVVVAWLPGAHGATILPYVPGQPLHITLPAAASVRGRVTLGGRSVANVKSSFRVLAAYQGRGVVNSVLSVDLTPQVDGTFLLAGLTPGTYQVQAVRDGIWMSATRTLTVKTGILPAVKLDIPEAGQAVDLRMVDAAGNPLPGATVRVSHPQGPLTDEIWPKAFTADGAGRLQLEGLNAGPETLTVFLASDGAPPDLDKSLRPIARLKMDIPMFHEGDLPLIKVLTCGPSSP